MTIAVDAGQLEEAETTGLTDEGKSDEKRRTPTETCEQVERLMMVSRPAKRTSTSPVGNTCSDGYTVKRYLGLQSISFQNTGLADSPSV